MTSISRSRSATSRLSRVSSASRAFRRFVSGTSFDPEALAPRVQRRLAHLVPLRHLGQRSLVRLPKDLHHLLFREPALSHRASASGGHALKIQLVCAGGGVK